MSLLRKLSKKVGQLVEVKLVPSEVSNGLGRGPLAPVLEGAMSIAVELPLDETVELGAVIVVGAAPAVVVVTAAVDALSDVLEGDDALVEDAALLDEPKSWRSWRIGGGLRSIKISPRRASFFSRSSIRACVSRASTVEIQDRRTRLRTSQLKGLYLARRHLDRGRVE